VVSCAQKVAATADSGRPKSLNARVNEKVGFTQDAEGNWKPLVNRRSSFESKGDSAYFKGAFKGDKEYKGSKTSDYGKKSWWGNKDYALKEYSGKTDASRFQKDSKYGGQTSNLGEKNSTFGDKSAREGGKGGYATKDAHEADGKILDHPSDAATDARRRVFTPPAVIDWSEQRKLSVQETKGILGKE